MLFLAGCFFIQPKIKSSWSGKMTGYIKLFAIKPDDLSSSLGTHMAKGES